MILVDAWNGLKQIGWFLPGFLLYAAFPPMCETTDVLFALAPLIWLSRQGDAKKSAKRWAQSGFFFWIATLSWMPAIIKNGGPWPLVLLGWVALAVYCTFYFAAYGYLSAAYWRWADGRFRWFGILIVEPVLWCGLELVRSRFGGGFAWNQLGVVPVNAGFGAPAALGGVYLCSAVVFLINGTIAGIAERVIANIRKRWRKSFDPIALSPWRTLETIFAFALIYIIYSSVSILNSPKQSESSPSPEYLKVALVQRNFPCCFKTQEENPIEIYSNLFMKVALLKPDLVVLPESAMSEFGHIESSRAFIFGTEWALRETGASAVLAGGTRIKESSPKSSATLYNSAALYGHGRVSIYDKVHLVPFGEFIPGDKWFPALQKFAPVGSCTPGRPKLLSLKLANRQPTLAIPFGVAICFEDTDSALMRDYARRGAEFLCFITNDSWFSNSNEALAHAWQATARAIETGLPVVRVGNSGVTGTITATGKASWLCGADGKVLVDKQGTMFDRLQTNGLKPLNGVRTPYVRYGDYPLGIAFVLLISGMVMVKYKNYVHEKRRRMSLQVG